MWSNESVMPTYTSAPDLVEEYPLPLGFIPEAQDGLTWASEVVRTYTEFDTHYFQGSYKGVRLVFEISHDASPYATIFHDEPCRPFGPNECFAKVNVECKQGTGLESLDLMARSFSAPESREEPIFWVEPVTTDSHYERFGRAILGTGAEQEEAIKAGRTVSQNLRKIMLDRRAPWWPVWQEKLDRWIAGDEE